LDKPKRIMIRLGIEVSEVFASAATKNDFNTKLRSDIAAVGQIPTSIVQVVSVLPGSVVVTFDILKSSSTRVLLPGIATQNVLDGFADHHSPYWSGAVSAATDASFGMHVGPSDGSSLDDGSISVESASATAGSGATSASTAGATGTVAPLTGTGASADTSWPSGSTTAVPTGGITASVSGTANPASDNLATGVSASTTATASASATSDGWWPTASATGTGLPGVPDTPSNPSATGSPAPPVAGPPQDVEVENNPTRSVVGVSSTFADEVERRIGFLEEATSVRRATESVKAMASKPRPQQSSMRRRRSSSESQNVVSSMIGRLRR
jgi:hypothetical protein